jgi:lysyl-tRNA synthetase class 2
MIRELKRRQKDRAKEAAKAEKAAKQPAPVQKAKKDETEPEAELDANVSWCCFFGLGG